MAIQAKRQNVADLSRGGSGLLIVSVTCEGGMQARHQVRQMKCVLVGP